MKKKRTPAKKTSSGMKKRVSVRRTAKPVVRKVVAKKVNTKKATAKPVAASHTKGLRRVGFSLKPLHLGMHAVIAVSAIGALFILGAVDQERFSTRISDAMGLTETNDIVRNTATIGLEYKSPLTLDVLIARKTEAGYVSLSNTSSEDIVISVPSDWKRLEVTGTSLDHVVAGVPTFGFTSWTLPADAGVKFSSSSAPEAIFFSTVSTATAAITLRTVDLNGELSTADTKVVLVKSQALAPLWIEG